MTDHLNYFALFYVAGIIVFGLLMRIRYRSKRNKNLHESEEKKRVYDAMARKIAEDAMNPRRERDVADDS